MDVDARQRPVSRHIEWRGRGVAASGGAIEDDLAVRVYVAQEAELRCTECLESAGIGLRGIPRPIDFIVQDNQDAFSARFWGHRGADGIEQVERAVCADGCGRAHRTDEDNGPVVHGSALRRRRGKACATFSSDDGSVTVIEGAFLLGMGPK